MWYRTHKEKKIENKKLKKSKKKNLNIIDYLRKN